MKEFIFIGILDPTFEQIDDDNLLTDEGRRAIIGNTEFRLTDAGNNVVAVARTARGLKKILGYPIAQRCQLEAYSNKIIPYA